MVKLFVFIVSALLAVSYCAPIFEDEEGQQYLLVALQRHRRDLSEQETNFEDVNEDLPMYLSRQKRQDHQVGAGAIINPGRSMGGSIDYKHIPSGSGLGVSAVNQRAHGMNLGTNVHAEGKLNLWRNKDGRLDAVGNYDRNYGGAFGTSRPSYYGGLQFNHRF